MIPVRREEGYCEYLLYLSLCFLADTLDTLLATIAPSSRPIQSISPSDVDELTDEEISRVLLESFPKVHPDYNVFRLSPGTVVKMSYCIENNILDCTEANALRLVFDQTSIPVPRVRRVINRTTYHLIIMDYVPGRTLDQVWSTYSFWRKVRVAFTLRRYVRQLRGLKASPTTPPGPLSVYGPRICTSPVFDVRPERGPFDSFAKFAEFFNKCHKVGLNARKIPKDHAWRKEGFDEASSYPLVFTHQDINPRNLIVGDDGRIWMIDFGWAGYYPPWFEFVTMHHQLGNEAIGGFNHHLWQEFIPFICGPYFKQRKWLSRIAYGFYYHVR